MKTILLSLTLVAALSAADINFKQASSTKRVSPVKSDFILSYNNILAKTTPSIVHISTIKTASEAQVPAYMHEFFGNQLQQPQRKQSAALGSGVVLSENGYIITNNHVIEGADEITVTLPNSAKEYQATLIGTDPKTDLAVIKIETNDKLIPIALADSSKLKVGDIVFAIGNPFGVGQSVTQGIISAQHKSGIGINEYENFIQTDASINPGNSGGALVDSRGALIGINSAILSRSGGNNGIGFAIEVNMMKNIVKKLIKDGKVTRGYMGVQIGDITANLQNLYNSTKGALLVDVNLGTPAEKSGLKRGDLILKINSHSIKSASDLKNRVGMLEPGLVISIEYERNKKSYTTSLTLQNQDILNHVESEVLGGLNLSVINDTIRQKYRIPPQVEGLLVTKVKPGSEAMKQGIRQGDVIIQVQEYQTNDITALKAVLKEYKGEYKRVFISRAGRIYVVALR